MTLHQKTAWFALTLLALFHLPFAMSAPCPRPREQMIFPTKGSGAAALLSRPATVSSSPLAVPTASFAIAHLPSPLPSPPAELWTQSWFFAATAVDVSGLESDFSNEVSLVTTNNPRPKVTLAWSPSPSTNQIGNYRVYHGGASANYTSSANAGTNLTLTLQLGPPLYTNVLIRVTSQNATNLQWSMKPSGPWTLLGATNWTTTNPPSPRFWRPLGRSPTKRGKAFISATPF